MTSEGSPPPDDDAAGRPRQRRVLWLFAPLLISLTALGGWLVWRDVAPAGSSSVPATAMLGTTTFRPSATEPSAAVTAPATDVPGDGFGIVAGPATPWAVAGGPGAATAAAATATAMPAPTLGPIALLGPPAGSAFRPADAVVFYWSAPAAGPGQQFELFLAAGDETIRLGVVAAANLGQAYQLQAAPGAAVGQPGIYSWFVVATDSAGDAIIGQSENRPITILAGN